MENILLPSTIRYEDGERPNEGILIVEPCFHGYGTTLGNALRRVLLSSLPGAAVTAMKLKGVTHEFQALEGVKEDALEIILNLKSLRMRVHTDEPVVLKISKTGVGDITGADITANADVEVMNPEFKICTVTDAKLEFEMELTVRRGRGYQSTEERPDEVHDLGTIAIDSLFSPIRNVGYRVEDTRVGEITNYDRLIMNIETDGTIEPKDAVERASKMLIDYFSVLLPADGAMSAPEQEEVPAETGEEEEN